MRFVAVTACPTGVAHTFLGTVAGDLLRKSRHVLQILTRGAQDGLG